MYIIKNETYFIDKIKEDQNQQKFKFIAIMDKFYCIWLEELYRSNFFQTTKLHPLKITKELLDSFPPVHQSLKFVTPELLELKPILMIEDPHETARYYRLDGRHRCIGAHRLGMTEVPAVWIAKVIWSRYLICRESKGGRHQYEPLSWDRSPGAPSTGSGEHFEPHFPLPEGCLDIRTVFDKPRSQNARQSIQNMNGMLSPIIP